METSKEIAQWVIDNRWPKGENDKVSNLEMFHEIVRRIDGIANPPDNLSCSTCRYNDNSNDTEPCNSCDRYSKHTLKNCNNCEHDDCSLLCHPCNACDDYSSFTCKSNNDGK